jgi:predicted metal-dependent phosphoesterase TrpH
MPDERSSAIEHERMGTADLHIHTLASDGISGVAEILEAVEGPGVLDVIAITDHERIDAAVAARTMAQRRGIRTEVIVGEEVTTRGGHLLALFIERPVRPMRSLRDTIIEIHAQGGLAIPAHPVVPVPLCASEAAIRRLVADPDPRARPDGLEAFNPTTAGRPWQPRVAALATELGLAAVGNSDAHLAAAVGQARTRFPGRTAEDLRRAILERQTGWEGEFYPASAAVATLLRQIRKYAGDARDELVGVARGRRTGRDLGYPGGRRRPAAFDEDVLAGR